MCFFSSSARLSVRSIARYDRIGIRPRTRLQPWSVYGAFQQTDALFVFRIGSSLAYRSHKSQTVNDAAMACRHLDDPSSDSSASCSEPSFSSSEANIDDRIEDVTTFFWLLMFVLRCELRGGNTLRKTVVQVLDFSDLKPDFRT